MTTNEWIVTCLIAALTTLLGVAGYFIQKWIQSVDESLKDNAQEIKAISKEVAELNSKTQVTTEDISTAVRAELGSHRGQLGKLDKIEADLTVLKHITQEKILPQFSSMTEGFGKVTVIEKKLGEQESKLLKLFEIVKLMSVSGKKPQ